MKCKAHIKAITSAFPVRCAYCDKPVTKEELEEFQDKLK